MGLYAMLKATESANIGAISVPFAFDVHALNFSDDAPGLENALHKALADRKLNLSYIFSVPTFGAKPLIFISMI